MNEEYFRNKELDAQKAMLSDFFFGKSKNDFMDFETLKTINETQQKVLDYIIGKIG